MSSESDSSDEQLTPYQGRKRSFGEFRCEDCNRYWKSGNTWANRGQQCRSCGTLVYPFRQYRLRRRNRQGSNNKPHPEELCEKCEELGFCCRELDDDEDDDEEDDDEEYEDEEEDDDEDDYYYDYEGEYD